MIEYAAIPNATETLRDSFSPRMGISMTRSHLERVLLLNPLTSFPKIKAMFFFDLSDSSGTLFSLCSRATISNFSFFNLSIAASSFANFFHPTIFSAPSAVLEIPGWGGDGVYPVRYTFATPAPSAVRKTDPTLYALRMLWQTTTKLFLFLAVCVFCNWFFFMNIPQTQIEAPNPDRYRDQKPLRSCEPQSIGLERPAQHGHQYRRNGKDEKNV